MNGTATARAVAPVQGRSAARWRPEVAWRSLAYAATLVFCVGWTVALGKDLPWDGLNYHLYLGYSALTDRFGQDFFAAGTPSYLNPYAYVPLYLMTRAGIPALGIAIVLAALHAALLWLTYEIALVAGLHDERNTRFGFALLAVALAATNPILLQGIGSTYIDIPTGVLVAGGWLAVAHALRDGSTRAIALAGVLCGLAAGLKLTNAAFALAALPALAFLVGSLRVRVRGALVFCASCGAAFAAVTLPWAWKVWSEFGNPLFPFLNQYFASPDFTVEPLRPERFRPGSWGAALARPFEMLAPRSLVHAETRAPDLRYVALAAALMVWGSLAYANRIRRVGDEARTESDPAAFRVLAGLTVGLAAAWCLWLAMSGNSRYFVAMACVASVVLALVLQRLYLRWRDATLCAVVLVAGIQVVQIALGSDWRRGGLAWEGPWTRIAVPERFRHEPYLYLSLGFLSGSAFAPHLDPRSGIVNVGGFYVLGPGRPGGARTQALIDRNSERLRLLMPLPFTASGERKLPGPPENLSVLLRRFGLRVDPSDCDFLSIEGNLRGIMGAAEKVGTLASAVPTQHFLTCRLRPAPEAALAYAREVRQADLVFDRVEDACPNLFHPRRPVTEQRTFWYRTYPMGSEVQLWIDDGRVKYFAPVPGGDPIEIGTVEDWIKGPRSIDCSRKSAPAFGGILE